MLLGILTVYAQPVALAQETTPVAEEEEIPEGVSFEAFAFGHAAVVPSAPAEALLARFKSGTAHGNGRVTAEAC